MGELKTFYKVIPKHWDEKMAYFIAEKVIIKGVYGKIYIRYRVLSRWCVGSIGKMGVFNDYYYKTEEYQLNDREVIVCNKYENVSDIETLKGEINELNKPDWLTINI